MLKTQRSAVIPLATNSVRHCGKHELVEHNLWDLSGVRIQVRVDYQGSFSSIWSMRTPRVGVGRLTSVNHLCWLLAVGLSSQMPLLQLCWYRLPKQRNIAIFRQVGWHSKSIFRVQIHKSWLRITKNQNTDLVGISDFDPKIPVRDPKFYHRINFFPIIFRSVGM